MIRPMNEEEKKWQRRCDARTLAEAEAIKADRQRFNEAQIGAKEILQEEADRLRSLSKVASNRAVNKVIKNTDNEVNQQSLKNRSYSNPATVGKLIK